MIFSPIKRKEGTIIGEQLAILLLTLLIHSNLRHNGEVKRKALLRTNGEFTGKAGSGGIGKEDRVRTLNKCYAFTHGYLCRRTNAPLSKNKIVRKKEVRVG